MEEYYESCLPEPYVILGRKLKPLSVGHLLILHRIGCLPVDDNDSLLLSVLVCSEDATKLDDIFEDPWLDWKIRIWRMFLGEPDWLRCHELWLDYFQLHMRMPEHRSTRENKSGGLPSALPFLQMLCVTLQSKCNYSPTEARTVPFQQAIWDYLSYHELEGNVEILDMTLREELHEKAKALQARVDAENEGNKERREQLEKEVKSK